jgi:hypothetical protein
MGNRGDHWDGSKVVVRDRKAPTFADEGGYFATCRCEKESWTNLYGWEQSCALNEAKRWAVRLEAGTGGLHDHSIGVVRRHVRTLLKAAGEA